MENFKGTPGPWKQQGELSNIITSNDGVEVAIVDNRYDAKLIATAPELLEAVDRINKIVYANVIVVGSDDYFEIRKLCDRLIKKVTE